MQNEILIEQKTHYGTTHVYVLSEHAEHIQALTGSKCLSKKHIEALQDLGFTFVFKQPRLNVES